jgi:hypothetical protein
MIACQCAVFPESACLRNLRSSGLRVAILARKFAFRQGLWIEDLQIPPGQECSNGSLILLAVVLWRTFSVSARPEPVLSKLERSTPLIDQL